MKPEEHAFIDEIATNPHDISTKLIFADWLEEQGDNRADLLRRGCELQQLHQSDYFSRADNEEKYLEYESYRKEL